jgi:hypothetical protein
VREIGLLEQLAAFVIALLSLAMVIGAQTFMAAHNGGNGP